MSGRNDKKIGPIDAASGGKRQRNEDEEDMGSQQSIFKWMRHVPGPLQDIMKKRADLLDNSQIDHNCIANTNSDRFSVAIATVFDDGPWVDMCQYLGMPAMSGMLYGNIKIRSLKHTVQSIVEDDEALAKVPQLLVLIKSVHYVDEEIVAVLHCTRLALIVGGVCYSFLKDPTGEVEGYFHRELVEHLGPALVAGVGVLLHKVSVFTPTDAPVTGRRKSYLNITPQNVRQVFISKDPLNGTTTNDTVDIFNKEKEIEFQQESDNDHYNESKTSENELRARQFLQQRTVCDTSAELTFLSQRQVIHRNPPVRADPAAALTTEKKGKHKKSRKKQDEGSGLGKWQWSKLLPKTIDENNDDSAMDSTRAQKRRDLLDAGSHLVSLITKQNAQKRYAVIVMTAKRVCLLRRVIFTCRSSMTEDNSTSTGSVMPMKPVSVRFAPGTVGDTPSISRNSNSGVVIDLTQRSLSLQPHSACNALVNDSKSTMALAGEDEEDEDEDEDW
ncbi:hypothetical protein DD238_002380 [Peronospora effusa]|uniref:Homologous recombination OB-fold protein OB-fold domain-containing protein n=1 Tax=Peronospora effusa TaxID=542832 RepID=A0A3M6VJH2_9STRA|nr:hypothetical protein DD238_002380 [Peronospora effusa]